MYHVAHYASRTHHAHHLLILINITELSKEDKEKKFASLGNRSGKLIVDEDWDEDFAAEDLKILPTKISTYKPIPSFTNDASTSSPTLAFNSPGPSPITGTITQLGKGGSLNKKPFELLKSDAPHRRSFQMLPVDQVKKPSKIVCSKIANIVLHTRELYILLLH